MTIIFDIDNNTLVLVIHDFWTASRAWLKTQTDFKHVRKQRACIHVSMYGCMRVCAQMMYIYGWVWGCTGVCSMSVWIY